MDPQLDHFMHQSVMPNLVERSLDIKVNRFCYYSLELEFCRIPSPKVLVRNDIELD